MFTKEKFVNIIKKYQELEEKDEKFNQALDEYDADNYHCFLPSVLAFETIGYELLGYALGLDMENREDEDLLGWYIYESECGTKRGSDKIIEIDSTTGEEKQYDVSTPEGFYDYVEYYLLNKSKGGK